MRKGFLSSTAFIVAIAGIGVAFSQEPTAPNTPKSDGVTRVDASRPPLLRRPLFGFFKRPQPGTTVAAKDAANAPVSSQDKAVVTVSGKAAAPVAVTKSTLPPIPEIEKPLGTPPTSVGTTGQAIVVTNIPMNLPNLPEIADPVALKYAKQLEECGHGPNYTWITGVLIRKPGVPNVWFIHYMPANSVPDLHKGCVAVQSNHAMSEFREGDMVTVIGYIITNVEVAPNQRVTGFTAEQVNRVVK